MPEQGSDAVLEGAELQEVLDSPLTYQEVGGTRGNLPDRYHHLRRTLVLGSGQERFEEAARTLLAWEMHRRAGVSVRASSPSVG